MNYELINKLRYLTMLVLFCSLIILIMQGCAGIDTSRTITPVKIQLTDNQTFTFKVAKCLLDQRTNTYYVMEQDRPNIYLYRDKVQLNTIGGLGNENVNFKKLVDIAIDPDGNLLALDEFARLIRKYTPDGKWVADIDISLIDQPAKLCVTPESDVIVYDSATKELQKISNFNGKSMFTFGRFQVDSVSNISCSRDFVAVVNDNKDKTILFTGMGLYLKDLLGQVVLDFYQNQYSYLDGAVKLSGSDLKVPFGKPDADVTLYGSSQYLILVDGNNVSTILPSYQGKQE